MFNRRVSSWKGDTAVRGFSAFRVLILLQSSLVLRFVKVSRLSLLHDC